MLQTIENETVRIVADPFIGQLTSFQSKQTGKEYLWNGNPDFWPFHAPILFPIVGRVVDGQYRHENKTYEIPLHGFIRTSTFTVRKITENSIVFGLTQSPETLAVYPFDFDLELSYVLGKNSVNTFWTVKNTNTFPMLFSTGGHPALMCPFNEGETFDDYYLEFEKPEKAIQMVFGSAYLTREEKPFLTNETILPLVHSLFKNDAIILRDMQSSRLCLKSRKSNNYVSFDYPEFPYLGIWTKVGAPFLCIEPWFGHADYEDFKGEFKDKAGILNLEPGKVFSCSYNMEIHE